MTRDSDFKQVVRARMAETGESYTAAPAATRARRRTTPRGPSRNGWSGRLFTDGRIERVPAKRKVRAAVLLEVVSRFEPGRDYSEPEVNEVLLGVHEDFAYLRRELVNYHYLEREDGRYRTAAQAPERSAIERQEIPDVGGALASGGFLAGASSAAGWAHDAQASTPRWHRPAPAAPSARRPPAGGSTCAAARSAVTSGAATRARRSTRPPTTRRPGTR